MMKKFAAFAFVAAAPLFAAEPPGEGGVFMEAYRECRIVAIQDQSMTMPGRLFSSIDPNETFKPAKAYAASLNVFLVQDLRSGKNALIDAGYGKAENRLVEKLAVLNVKPEDISAVFITHIHPDHVGGLTTPEGKAAFPNASILIARREYEEWRRDPARAALARHLTPNLDRLILLDYDREVAPFGLTPLYYPGHTPGHTVFRMAVTREGNAPEPVFFVGDIVHAGELQIPHPQFCARFDKTPATAVKSRRELLKAAPVWHGAHLPFPGIARILHESPLKSQQSRGRIGFAKSSPR